ncbi:hypothetical protein AVEN_114633-1 [Araneus ventricosus]|uniref:Uncharacterized protein n=1 Tax=Araneus ventricosus TaxID=182803 RepID=A0A4Y2GE34_ARAVE|nr:hypothetical protein AVEN_114633-1 [Araneus ventricosus]
MIQPGPPLIEDLLVSPTEKEIEEGIKIVSTHASPYDEVAKITIQALSKIRAALARAETPRPQRRLVLEGAISLISAIYKQTAELGVLQAEASLLEEGKSENFILKEKVAFLSAENDLLKQQAAQAPAPSLQPSPSPAAPSYASAMKRVPREK